MARESIEVIRMKGAKAAFESASRSSEFRSAAEAAPFMLRTMGLGAGVAALASKEGQGRVFAELVSRWLIDGCAHSPYRDADTAAAGDTDRITLLLTRIASSGRDEYRAAQIEAIGFASWLKRLAQAFCERESI